MLIGADHQDTHCESLTANPGVMSKSLDGNGACACRLSQARQVMPSFLVCEGFVKHVHGKSLPRNFSVAKRPLQQLLGRFHDASIDTFLMNIFKMIYALGLSFLMCQDVIALLSGQPGT